MSRDIEMIGLMFGRLRVVKRAPDGAAGRRWACVCLCGNETVSLGYDLRSGHSKSCGCLASDVIRRIKTKHGHAPKGRQPSSEYVCFKNMHGRCYDTKDSSYHRYGGRGIMVCPRWHDFNAFIEDMGLKPSRRHSLDRIDPNGHYEPSNCRWATSAEQQNNRTNNRLVTWLGITRTLSEWSHSTGIPTHTLGKRLARWPLDRAMTHPLRPDRRRHAKK